MPHTEEVITVEFAWCPECREEGPVEIVAFPDDPAPVAICLECSIGVETYDDQWQETERVPVSAPPEHARAS